MLQDKYSEQARSPLPGLPLREEFVIREGHVLTMDAAIGNLPCADVHVRNGEIVAVGEKLQAPGAHELSGNDMIVMPGFVDTHWHLWNSSLRALVRGDDAQNGYFPVTLRLGPLFTPEDSYRSLRLGLTEGLLMVCFNYRSYDPKLRFFKLQWTEQELKENHLMVIQYAKHKGLL